MRRKTFDALVSAGGLVLVAVLLVAGVLMLWGHSYASDQVSSQLSAQKIVFPAKGNAEFKALPASDQAAMGAYAGQPMTTGAQAKTYADHFIAVHLGLIGKGKTYSQLSAASLAQPKNVALAARCRPCSAAPPCARCCSRPTASGRSARSPCSPPSRPSPAPACC